MFYLIKNLHKGKGVIVSTYDIHDLIKRWEREDVTIEQVVGQLLLHTKEHNNKIPLQQRQLETQQQQVSELSQRMERLEGDPNG